MPLYELYSKQMESRIADINNLGTPSRAAGSCTAAAFLKVSLNTDTYIPVRHMLATAINFCDYLIL